MKVRCMELAEFTNSNIVSVASGQNVPLTETADKPV